MTPALEFVDVCKRFAGVWANEHVSISIAAQSIHGVIGENGAGKSTLMSILSGERSADSGEIRIDGRRVAFASPRDAQAHGVGMVHQHFLLIDAMSVLDNIMLGAEGGAWLSRGRAAMRQRLDALGRDYGLVIDADAIVGTLPVGLRQRVEILKALTRNARILAFDEPTAVLTPNEAADLFALMRTLRDAGVCIIFITHKLREVLAITDRVTVMRRGAVVADFETARTSAAELAQAMIGRPAFNIERAPRTAGPAIFSAKNLEVLNDYGATCVKGVSFDLHAGEIVGLAGVSGNGQSELLEALAGMRKPTGGSLALDGVTIAARDHNPRGMRARGVIHVPEDRMRNGLVADFEACESAMLGYQYEPRYGHRLLDHTAIETDCADIMTRWDIRPPSPHLTTASFSGGNQQKLVLAREIERNPRVLLIGQPTRGVDVGAIESIHARLLAMRDAGKAILLVSNELDEILAICDRILVMHAGRVVGERRPHDTNARELGLMMAGAA
jgi:ABC-type uncharacterized transport system ATPase subunit